MRPSLLLDFAKTKMLDKRITFTRNSKAGYFDRNGVYRMAAAGEPRFDFDPITGACKGLLIEEQRTNLLTYSEQFDNAAWNKLNSTVISSTVAAPDGTPTADKLVETNANGVHQFAQPASIVSGTVYASTVYAKAAERTEIIIGVGTDVSAAFVYGRFNLQTGVASSFLGSPSATMTPLGNGWYRCSMLWTANVTATATAFGIQVLDGSGNNSYTGDGVSGLFIWGAQLEAGAFPTSYIKTGAAQVTRAADVATMTGANFSSWYRQDEGSFVCAGDSANVGTESSSAVAAFKDSNNYQRIQIGGTYSDITAVSGGVTQVDTTGIAFAQGSAVTTAMAYKSNDYAQSSNGGAVETDASATLPVGIDTLNIGATTSGSNVLNGHISRLAYYPKRLTNTELQALTA